MKKPIVHYLTVEHAIACNNDMGGASGWRHTRDPKLAAVTCGRCLKVMKAKKKRA